MKTIATKLTYWIVGLAWVCLMLYWTSLGIKAIRQSGGSDLYSGVALLVGVFCAFQGHKVASMVVRRVSGETQPKDQRL